MPRQRSDLAVQQEQTPIDLQPEENLYTVSEVAKRLRVDTTTVNDKLTASENVHLTSFSSLQAHQGIRKITEL